MKYNRHYLHYLDFLLWKLGLRKLPFWLGWDTFYIEIGGKIKNVMIGIGFSFSRRRFYAWKVQL